MRNKKFRGNGTAHESLPNGEVTPEFAPTEVAHPLFPLFPPVQFKCRLKFHTLGRAVILVNRKS